MGVIRKTFEIMSKMIVDNSGTVIQGDLLVKEGDYMFNIILQSFDDGSRIWHVKLNRVGSVMGHVMYEQGRRQFIMRDVNEH